MCGGGNRIDMQDVSQCHRGFLPSFRAKHGSFLVCGKHIMEQSNECRLKSSPLVCVHRIVGDLRPRAHMHPYKFSEQRTGSLIEFEGSLTLAHSFGRIP